MKLQAIVNCTKGFGDVPGLKQEPWMPPTASCRSLTTACFKFSHLAVDGAVPLNPEAKDGDKSPGCLPQQAVLCASDLQPHPTSFAHRYNQQSSRPCLRQRHLPCQGCAHSLTSMPMLPSLDSLPQHMLLHCTSCIKSGRVMGTSPPAM